MVSRYSAACQFCIELRPALRQPCLARHCKFVTVVTQPRVTMTSFNIACRYGSDIL